jgi:hypothetical protein
VPTKTPNVMPVFAKINRSVEHLDALNEACKRFFEEQGEGLYRINGKPNTQRTKYLLRFEVLQPVPVVEWGVIAGDAVHCLRTALDQLTYELSLDPDNECGFPICRTRKDWETKSPAMLWGVPQDLIAVFDKSQPYHRGDDAHAHPLAILNTLSNTDKHRTIPIVALVPDEAEFEVVATQGIASHGKISVQSGRLLENDAVVAEIRFKPDNSGLQPQMHMNGNLGFRIAFGKGPGVPGAIARKPLMPTFGKMGEAVKQVITDLHEVIKGVLARGGTLADG